MARCRGCGDLVYIFALFRAYSGISGSALRSYSRARPDPRAAPRRPQRNRGRRRDEAFRAAGRARRRLTDGGARPGARPARPERRRQDDPAADPQRHRQPRRGHGDARRPPSARGTASSRARPGGRPLLLPADLRSREPRLLRPAPRTSPARGRRTLAAGTRRPSDSPARSGSGPATSRRECSAAWQWRAL